MRKVELTQGKFALVDDADFELVSTFRWSYTHGYAVRAAGPRGSAKRIYMHNLLCPVSPPFVEVDHIDGNKLNNQRANLRPVTRGENSQNKPARAAHGFKGVCFNRGKYIAQIAHNKKHYHLGRFSKIEDAALAYDEAAAKLYGEHARRNFPVTEVEVLNSMST